MPLEMAITPRLVAYCHFHWYPQSLDATILRVYIIYIDGDPHPLPLERRAINFRLGFKIWFHEVRFAVTQLKQYEPTSFVFVDHRAIWKRHVCQIGVVEAQPVMVDEIQKRQ